MSDNKFIERLKGKATAKSVLEVKNQATKLSFANMPQGTSNAIDVFSDHRGNATAVLNGTTNWKISNSNLLLANTVSGDGQDFLSTYSVSGTGLWVNSSYTFPSTGDPRHPIAMVFNPSTKWVLKVCGDNLIVDGGSTIDFTMLVKIGTANVYSKNFTVRESAGQFSKEFVIDFGEANLDIVKAGGLSTLTVQLLCGTANASARIYNGMSVLTCLQRKVDASAVSNNNANVEDVLDGNMIPNDYFSNPAFIDQIEDGDEAYAVFTRDGDNVDLSGWAQPIPDQANNNGKFLNTDGSSMSWEQIEISNIDGLQTELTDLQDKINDKVNETSTANKVYGTDNNGDQTTYNISDLGPGDFTGATAGDAGTNGLVPAPAAGDQAKFLQGDGTWANPTAATAWGNITGTLSNQTDLQSALNVKQDTLTAGTNISIVGTTISATDTTYTGSNGITLTGTNFTNSGVRSVATGTTSGTISVDTNGTSADVAVNGWSGKADVATTLAGYGITDGYTKSEVDTLLTGKVDTGNEIIAYQAPTSGNNYSWYCKYKNGWVIQGGRQTGSASISAGTSGNLGSITLPVAMADDRYVALATGNENVMLIRQDVSSTSITFRFGAYGTGTTRTLDYVRWLVAGKAAS